MSLFSKKQYTWLGEFAARVYWRARASGSQSEIDKANFLIERLCAALEDFSGFDPTRFRQEIYGENRLTNPNPEYGKWPTQI